MRAGGSRGVGGWCGTPPRPGGGGGELLKGALHLPPAAPVAPFPRPLLHIQDCEVPRATNLVGVGRGECSVCG